MKRLIKYDLDHWKVSHTRKPLMMRGARQVGKTYAARELGKTFAHFVEINFELRPDFIEIFEKDLDPVRIVNALVTMTRQSIIPGETLLFFDEIQACPKAIIALRYFYEMMPALHVLAAGSLLDFAIDQVGVPVGRIEFCYVYPLSFMEYLASLGHHALIEMILALPEKKTLDVIFHKKLFELLGQYMLLGGMPEVIMEFIKQKNIAQAYHLQKIIVNAYRNDFPKYTKKLQIKYIETLFHYIPRSVSQLFKFSHVDGDYQKRELSPALTLLEKAGIIHKIVQTAANGFPLGAEAKLDRFKLILLDVGLNQIMLGNSSPEFLFNPLEAFVNKGALTEAFVGQELVAYSPGYAPADLYYWHRENQTSNAEVDYVISLQDRIIPIEVKSGKGSTLKSLHIFLENKSKATFGVRFSTHPYSVEKKLHSYPLYAIASFLTQHDQSLREKLQKMAVE